jgi:hypothetical protein
LKHRTNLITPTLIPVGLFPTMDSLEDVMDYAESKLPVTNKNDMTSILYTYHNTLLKINHENQNKDSLSR